MGIKIEKISGAVGAEISGIQIEDICKHDFKLVNNALLDHGVIYFRRQNITPTQQLDFAKMWNDLHLHPYLNGLPEFPELSLIHI